MFSLPGPGPKSGAVLIMAPLGLGAGGQVGEDPKFCLVIKEALLAVYVHGGSDTYF